MRHPQGPDPYGRIRHDKPYYALGKDGRVVPTDAYGHKRYDRPHYKVEGGNVYETDAYGNVRQQKFEIKNEKVTFEVSGAMVEAWEGEAIDFACCLSFAEERFPQPGRFPCAELSGIPLS